LELNGLVRATVRLVAPEARLRRATIAEDLAAGLPAVRGDRVQLQQVLINLMINALDALSAYPVGERRLTVMTHHDGGFVAVSVTDGGPGIAQEVLPRIFEPFYTTKEEGMGMGLSIARTIIEAHRGRIEACNRPAGGATVCVSLPAASISEERATS
jgi:C4-dicarboxylate-specific signal transduction histidine kinase